MKVAVHLDGQPVSAGGGFTFEQEVLDCLVRLAPETRHSFVIIGAPPAASRPFISGRLTFAPAIPQRLRRVAQLTRRLWLDPLLRRLDVDLVWNLSPFHSVTDTPFISIVWDLQHRRQPFFPEVSANGEWRLREREYAARLQRALTVITGTEVGKGEIVGFYRVAEERIRVLPHPTPRFALTAPPTASRSFLGAHGLTAPYLLYPAQFWAHKNHAGLLLALDRLRREHELRPLLALVGSDQGCAAHVRRLARDLGLADQVRFLGFVSQTDLVTLYRHALALTYITFFGPENLPPLEAFALGCPVIASDVAGAREQLGSAALLVDATDPGRIAEAIKLVHDDAVLRHTLITRGQARACRWTGDDFVRGVFRLLDDAIPLLRCWRPNAAREQN